MIKLMGDFEASALVMNGEEYMQDGILEQTPPPLSANAMNILMFTCDTFMAAGKAASLDKLDNLLWVLTQPSEKFVNARPIPSHQHPQEMPCFRPHVIPARLDDAYLLMEAPL